ncbi:hypothetical protein B0H19DRAFT_1263040 [Mycena capillaripes]|nr:hypothetical protein B0H19DRAFT_1263040 [Mycena capillaripes]
MAASCPPNGGVPWNCSVPEEDYISVHIHVVGDFTQALARSVGCDFASAHLKGAVPAAAGKVVNSTSNPAINHVLPWIMIDGPFGTSSEDFLNYETVMFVGGGIGDINNIVVQDIGAEKNSIISLRAPIHSGRPNWDRIFTSLGTKHPESDVGVFFCGPSQLGSS